MLKIKGTNKYTPYFIDIFIDILWLYILYLAIGDNIFVNVKV